MAATPAGPLIPSPFSSLQRGLFRIEDPTVVRPRGDLEYYTLEDVEAGAAAGDSMFLRSDGSINYDLVGLVKGDWDQAVKETFDSFNSYMSQDSFFRDERDANAVLYDTLGNEIGAEDANIYTRPGLAIWNTFSGIRIRQGEELTPLQAELMRLADMTGGWPLSNRESMDGMKLGFGAQSDLTNLAKNEVQLRVISLGERRDINMQGATFRQALERLTLSSIYVRAPDDEKATLLRAVEQAYYNRAFEILLDMPEYANLNQAYRDLQNQRELEARGRR
jgi:hypothetical protein